MTRFGMGPADFVAIAELMAAVVNQGGRVAEAVADLRSRFTELQYCFKGPEFEPLVQQLHGLI